MADSDSGLDDDAFDDENVQDAAKMDESDNDPDELESLGTLLKL